MDGPQTIIALVFVALLITGSAIAINYSAETTAPEYDVNESTTTNGIGTIASFPNSSIDNAYYSDTAKVTNATDGSVLENGTGYEWLNSNGTLKVLSQDAANTTVYADYTFSEPNSEQETAITTIADLQFALSYLPWLLIIALIVITMTILGGAA